MGSKEATLACWKELLENGIYVNLVWPPAAPKGESLLRCSVSAAHTEEQIERLLTAFAELAHRSAAPLFADTHE
jgi:8-amino-7-oxononanoate synthase